jgi:hypothetical protein
MFPETRNCVRYSPHPPSQARVLTGHLGRGLERSRLWTSILPGTSGISDRPKPLARHTSPARLWCRRTGPGPDRHLELPTRQYVLPVRVLFPPGLVSSSRCGTPRLQGRQHGPPDRVSGLGAAPPAAHPGGAVPAGPPSGTPAAKPKNCDVPAALPTNCIVTRPS